MKHLASALLLCSCWCVSSWPLPAVAQANESMLDALFQHEADVFAARDGLVRLELPESVLRACRADLSDLRALDRSRRPTPYVAVRGLAAATAVRALPPQPARILEAQRHQAPLEAMAPGVHEVYELAAPDTTAPVLLHLRVASANFTRTVSITWLPASGPAVTLARATSVFRTPGAGEKLSLALGALGPGRVRVVLDGQGALLDPRFEWEGEPVPEAPARLSVELTVREQRELGDHTLVILDRPAGIVPSALVLTTESAHFERQLTVFDADPNRRLGELGTARLVRSPTLGSSALEVPLRQATGDRLEVEITDRDSPPLSNLGFVASVERPTLVLEVTGCVQDEPCAVLRFGGGRTRAVHYDLESLLGAVAAREGSEAFARKLAGLPIARLGVPRDNPGFEQAPPLYRAFPPGAALDPSQYAHRRRIEVPSSRDGVARVELTALDLAVARPDLADVRLVDSEQRQRPFLIEHDAQAREIQLPDPDVTHDDATKSSTYVFGPPAAPLTAEGLVFSTDARRFDRAFELRAREAEGNTRVLTTGRLTRGLDDAQSVIELPFARTRLAKLELVVRDEDDAPLTLRSPRAKAAMPTLYFAAEPAQYSLLLGNPQSEPPRYDLDSARDALLAVQSVAVEPGPLESNPTQLASSTLALFQRPGAVVDVQHYGWMRECNIAASRDGLARVPLSAADLARMRADLGDVRVVDGERRQRPYLLRDDAGEERLQLKLPPPRTRDGRTTWQLALPARPVPVTALVLTTRLPFFDRGYQIVGRDAADKEVQLGSGRLSRRAGSGNAPLVLSTVRTRISSLELIVDDGEDAPLPFEQAYVRVPLPVLYVVAPPGKYVLLLGHASAAAPSYEIERERDLVLAVQSREATLGPLSENPSHGVRARASSMATQELLLWLAFGLALAVLTTLTMRLVRREQV